MSQPEPELTGQELAFLLQLLEVAPLSGRPAELAAALDMIATIKAWIQAQGNYES